VEAGRKKKTRKRFLCAHPRLSRCHFGLFGEHHGSKSKTIADMLEGIEFRGFAQRSFMQISVEISWFELFSSCFILLFGVSFLFGCLLFVAEGISLWAAFNLSVHTLSTIGEGVLGPTSETDDTKIT
jgi:hypothetical protein